VSSLPTRLARASWRALKVFLPEVVAPVCWTVLKFAVAIVALGFIIRAERPIAHAALTTIGTSAWAVVQAKLVAGVLTGAAITLVMAIGGGFERSTALLGASWFFWTVMVSLSVLGDEARDAGIRWVDDASLIVLFISVFWVRWLKSKSQSAAALVAHT
jgi:hypothetical protein